MIQVTIDNPVINSPFEEPRGHFKFTKDGVTSEIAPGRRPSIHFTALPAPRRQSGQMSFLAEGIQENALINQLRREVAAWRRAAIATPAAPPTACLTTGPTPAAKRSFFSARSRLW